MIASILTMLTTFGAPTMTFVLKMLPYLYQYKILKTEAELKEWQRRFQAAIAEAERSAKDPVDAKKQDENSREDAEDEWQKKFGGK